MCARTLQKLCATAPWSGTLLNIFVSRPPRATKKQREGACNGATAATTAVCHTRGVRRIGVKRRCIPRVPLQRFPTHAAAWGTLVQPTLGAAAFVARRRRDALRSVTARPLLFSREEPRFLSFSSRALASRLTASTRPAACADGDSLLLSSAHASVAGPVCLQGKDSGCVI